MPKSIVTSKGIISRYLWHQNFDLQGVPKVSGRCFKNGFGIQMSQATPAKFSMLFKHNYGKLFWKFCDHSFNFSFVHGPSWLRVLESIHRYGIIFTFWFFFKRSLWGHAWCQKNLLYWLLKVFAWIFYWNWFFLF